MIVIIIIGVLTALALPRMFSMAESSRQAEALASITTIRNAIERCQIMHGGYNPQLGYHGACNASPGNFDNLGIDDPGTSPNAHFQYTVYELPQARYSIDFNIIANGQHAITETPAASLL